MAKVTMPQLGESVAEGTIGKWLKQPGDRVEKEEPLLEVITDKVNAEVPSPFAGVLREILVQEGATVPYNAEIAEIEVGEGTAAASSGAEASPKQPAAAGESAGAAAAPPATAGRTPTAPAPAAPPAPPSAAQPAPAAQQPAPTAQRPAPSPTPSPIPAPSGAPATPDLVPVMAEPEAPQPLPGEADARMTPSVRRMLREHGLSAAQVAGTGHEGRITREDVLAAVERMRGGGAAAAGPSGTAAAAPQPAVAPSAPPAPVFGVASHAPGLAPAVLSTSPAVTWEAGQDEVLIPHTQMRKGIAAQMTRAATIPVAHSTFEADMTAVVALRASAGEAYKAREGVGLSFLPFVVKAVVESLHEHPDLNAHYTDNGLLRKRHINIGIAIAVENGLIVPVIHDADGLSIAGLNRAIQDLAARARSNRLRVEDVQGGTFTVDNTGWFGSILTAPILNPPEVCILTTEAVVKRPVVRETPEGDVLAVRSMMNLVAGYDHRATDGAQVGKFVRDVICRLEAFGPDTPIY